MTTPDAKLREQATDGEVGDERVSERDDAPGIAQGAERERRTESARRAELQHGAEPYKYSAFISYRRSVEPDRTVAARLQQLLEEYRPPSHLAKSNFLATFGKVYRDDTGLAATPNLRAAILRELSRSRYLVVVCSPRTPASEWVRSEIEHFALERRDNVLFVLFEGERAESLPKLDEVHRAEELNGEGRAEPRPADIRAPRAWKRWQSLPLALRAWGARLLWAWLRIVKRDEFLRLIAPLVGCEFDELQRREQYRLRWRRVGLGVAAILVVGALAGFAIAFQDKSREAADRAASAKRAEMLSAAGGFVYDPARKAAILREIATSRARPAGFGEMASEVLRKWMGIPLECHDGPVGHIEFSADGQRALTVSDVSGIACVWRLEALRSPLLLTDVRSAAFTQDGQRVLVASKGPTVRVVRADGRGTPIVLEHRDHVVRFAASRDGSRVLTVTVNPGSVTLWRIESTGVGTALWRDDAATSAALAADGRSALAWNESTIRLRSAESDGASLEVPLDEPVSSAFITPNGEHILTQSSGGTRLWETQGVHAPVLVWHDPGTRYAVMSPGGEHVLALRDNGHARLHYGLASAEPLDLAESCAIDWGVFSPDGGWMFGADDSSPKACLWDLQDPTRKPFSLWPERAVWRVGLSRGGRWIVTSTRNATTEVWDTKWNTRAAALPAPVSDITEVSVSPDGTFVLTASGGRARLWTRRGSECVEFAHQEIVTSAGLSADGKAVLTVAGGTARLWHANGKGEVAAFGGPGRETGRAELDPKGERVLTWSASQAWVWNADGRSDPLPLPHDGYVTSGQFAPNGERVLTTAGRTAYLWRTESRAPPVALRGHEGSIHAAAFSGDGHLVVTASNDRTARLWNAANGEELRVMGGHEAELSAAVFNADGARILTTSRGTVRLWSSSHPGDPIERKLDVRVQSALFSPDGATVLTVSRDGATVRDAENRRDPRLLPDVRFAVFSPNGNRLLTVATDGAVEVQNARDGSERKKLGRMKDAQAWFAPDESRVLAQSGHSCSVWNADGSGDPLILRSLGKCQFSADGSHLLATEERGTVVVWPLDLQTSLWRKTSYCLPAEDRVLVLREAPDEARRGEALCQQTADFCRSSTFDECARRVRVRYP